MAEYQLKNQELTLKISSKGAEMKSLKDNKTNQEYLWHGDSAYWGRTSPVLFPIVGNYREKESVFEGKSYSMSQHGFARDMEFTLESQNEEEIWFELKENEETLKKYPFEFRLHSVIAKGKPIAFDKHIVINRCAPDVGNNRRRQHFLSV